MSIPIDELVTALKKKLKLDNIYNQIIINKINTATNETLDSATPSFNREIGVLTSVPLFIDRKNGIAVQAVILSPYLLILKRYHCFICLLSV